VNTTSGRPGNPRTCLRKRRPRRCSSRRSAISGKESARGIRLIAALTASVSGAGTTPSYGPAGWPLTATGALYGAPTGIGALSFALARPPDMISGATASVTPAESGRAALQGLDRVRAVWAAADASGPPVRRARHRSVCRTPVRAQPFTNRATLHGCAAAPTYRHCRQVGAPFGLSAGYVGPSPWLRPSELTGRSPCLFRPRREDRVAVAALPRVVDLPRITAGLTSRCSRPLKNRCVSGSVLNTIEPSVPRVSSTL
jgi:hypothetical protein